jgi:hypothetical protein
MSNQAPRPPLSSTRAVQQRRPARAPIQWAGILFALAANVMVVNLAHSLVQSLTLDITFEAIATFGAPLLVGILTTWYVKRRGGIHAFIGGMLSIPLLALTAFNGNWQFAVIAGAICGLGGSLSELIWRRSGR